MDLRGASVPRGREQHHAPVSSSPGSRFHRAFRLAQVTKGDVTVRSRMQRHGPWPFLPIRIFQAETLGWLPGALRGHL